MSKAILFLNGNYVVDIQQLKDLISSPRLVNNDAFRREVLSAYKDGILEKWYDDRKNDFILDIASFRDDDVFVSIYRYITGNSECPNFHSDFSKFGEFLRCEVDDKSCYNSNGEVIIDFSDTLQNVKFIFKSIKAENNIRVFSLKDNDVVIEKLEWNWSDKTKGHEHQFVFPIDTVKYEGKTLELTEGDRNVICRISIKYPESKDVSINGVCMTFYYVSSMRCWITKCRNKLTFKKAEIFINTNSKYHFKLLTKDDVSKIQKSDVWVKMGRSYFWLSNGRCYDPISKKVCEQSYSYYSEYRQFWVKVKELPTV